jgi:hypothetical protein
MVSLAKSRSDERIYKKRGKVLTVATNYATLTVIVAECERPALVAVTVTV